MQHIKITKSLSRNHNDSTVLQDSCVRSFVSFDRLKPYLEIAIGLGKNEEIIGIEVDYNGIHTIIKSNG